MKKKALRLLWERLNTVMKITATREFPSGKIEKQERFYISSLNTKRDFTTMIRSHPTLFF